MSSFRIPTAKNHLFSGHQINRDRPVQFRLNGRRISTFSGDTVLSALLASGIDTAGTHQGAPIALDACLGLAIQCLDPAGNPGVPLPMARTPVAEGARFQTLGTDAHAGLFQKLKRLTRNDSRSLGLDLDQSLLPPLPDTAPVEPYANADIVVVGGGLAGLSAAVEASEAGRTVILIEQRAYLGGDAVLFGHAAGEEAPESAFARLSAKVDAAENITVLTLAEAVEAATGQIVVHQVVSGDEGGTTARRLQLAARHIVLATGMQDRLPLFPGNRLPGVTSLSQTFHLATAFGVWPGKRAAVTTNTNAGYRLALLAQDAELAIEKVMDARLEPQSRFAEFTKAYGIKSESGVHPQSASFVANAAELFVKMELSWADGRDAFETLTTGALIVSGGWLPRLTLWQRAGGALEVDSDGKICAAGHLEGIALAGSCAGYVSNSAVMRSGAQAVDGFLGRSVSAIEDTLIDPAFESPDGRLPVSQAPETEVLAPRYFDLGSSLVSAPRPIQGSFFKPALRRMANAPTAIADKALSLGDIAALTAIGQVKPDAFATIAEERAVPPICFARSTASSPPAASASETTDIPAYLAHRFGDNTQLWEVQAQDGRRFETGNLLYANSDTHDPMDALGVITSVNSGNDRNAVALISAEAAQAGLQIMVRSQRGHTNARIIKVLKPN